MSTDTSSKLNAISPMVLSPSSASDSPTSLRGSFTSTLSRPTEEEASALWEIMSTPPQSCKVYSQDWGNQRSGKSSQPSSSPNITHPCASAALVSPKSLSSNSCEGSSALYGPPYESSLPHKPAISSPPSSSSLSPVHGKRFSLQLRSFRTYENKNDVLDCQHYGIGPYLSLLPESLMHNIIAYIDYFDRQPTMLLVSQGMRKILTNPDFMFALKHIHDQSRHYPSRVKKSLLSQVLDGGDAEEEQSASNELLLIVGGKVPTKTNNDDYTNNNSRGEGVQLMSTPQPLDEGRISRRMAMQNNQHSGIMGYDTRRKRWVRFGGDPLESSSSKAPSAASQSPRSGTTLHPLSPFGIVDSKPLFLGHPHHCLVFFGGTEWETGAASSRVVAYSFLSGRWETWPDMMRARHGGDFVVARVHSSQERRGPDNVKQEGAVQPCSCDDYVVLIGCDLELCDCFLCNPPSRPCDQTESPDTTIDMISFDHSECGDVGRTRREDFNSIGRCEVLDLKSKQWKRRKSRAPSCPPDDGGVAVVEGRYIYLPGTCPPPPATPTSGKLTTPRESDGNSNCSGNAELVTPLSQAEVNSRAEPTSIPATITNSDQYSASSMDTKSKSSEDDGILTSPLGNLFRSLHYRPGLRYDFWLDRWDTLPARPYVTTSSPTTCTFNDGTRDYVVVLGGYRSSSENALSCYRHREDDSILDYEDHLDFAWWYTDEAVVEQNIEQEAAGEADVEKKGKGALGKWTFGGGSAMLGHRQAWALSEEMAAAVAAAASLNDEMNRGNVTSCARLNLPIGAPAPVRGATATTWQGRLTMLGGLSTFSRTFYDSERKAIWQFFPEQREWRRTSMELPVPAILDGYTFSLHI